MHILLYFAASGAAATIGATLGGTAVGGLTRGRIHDGGKTITIGLTNDTWVAAGATFDAQRQNIIDNITSDGSEANGWNNAVRDNLAVTSVVRTSDTIVTVTLTAFPAYEISERENITVTVPATALVTSGSAVVAAPTILARPSNPLGGRRLRELVEVGGQFFDAGNVKGIAAARQAHNELMAELRAERDAERRRNELLDKMHPNVRELLKL